MTLLRICYQYQGHRDTYFLPITAMLFFDKLRSLIFSVFQEKKCANATVYYFPCFRYSFLKEKLRQYTSIEI